MSNESEPKNREPSTEVLIELAGVIAEMTRVVSRTESTTSQRIGAWVIGVTAFAELAGLVVVAFLVRSQVAAAIVVPGGARWLAGMIMAAIATAGLILFILSTIPSLLGIRRDPFGAVLRAVDTDIRGYAHFLALLASYPKSLLEYALMQYRFHRDAFEARIALTSGDLKKIGLFPAWLAVAAGAQKLTTTGNPWLWMPVVLAGCFYLLAFVFSDKPQQMTRVVSLLEHVVSYYDDYSCDGETDAAALTTGLPANSRLRARRRRALVVQLAPDPRWPFAGGGVVPGKPWWRDPHGGHKHTQETNQSG
ncbi:hypothetical protein PQQ75_32195 [Paraburkholderia aspalathi]|uniref:hypothetical protein n=1 Tax=Paraburkholderia aspalathi TaxID=1324617 RepID=UPI0038B80B08